MFKFHANYPPEIKCSLLSVILQGAVLVKHFSGRFWVRLVANAVPNKGIFPVNLSLLFPGEHPGLFAGGESGDSAVHPDQPGQAI